MIRFHPRGAISLVVAAAAAYAAGTAEPGRGASLSSSWSLPLPEAGPNVVLAVNDGAATFNVTAPTRAWRARRVT